MGVVNIRRLWVYSVYCHVVILDKSFLVHQTFLCCQQALRILYIYHWVLVLVSCKALNDFVSSLGSGIGLKYYKPQGELEGTVALPTSCRLFGASQR